MNDSFKMGRPEGEATMSPNLREAERYYRWIVSELDPYLRGHILDIGGGWGTHLDLILPHHESVVSIDCSASSVQHLRARFGSYRQFQAWQMDFCDTSVQDVLLAQRFNTIVILNVLEHIQDDANALSTMRLILAAQQGLLLLQVPAHQWLYGSLDRQAGHFRRYTVASLRRSLERAGFEPVKLHYFNAFGVIPWFINSRVLKTSLESGGVARQIKMFDRFLVPVLQAIESRCTLPFGQSIIAVARAR